MPADGGVVRFLRDLMMCAIFRTYCTEKKEKKSLLIYKEIQMRSGAKSYMRKGFLIYEEMRQYLIIYEEAVSHIQYDFATDPF